MNKPDHIDGMRYCLKLIEELREKYAALGWHTDMLSIERVLCDVENEIGVRAYKDWKYK
jgi:hypothetical protein